MYSVLSEGSRLFEVLMVYEESFLMCSSLTAKPHKAFAPHEF